MASCLQQQLLPLLGTDCPLNLTEGEATVTSSGFLSSRPPKLAIDGIVLSSEALCLSITGVRGKTWLRLDIQTVLVLLISKVRILFYNGSGTGVSTFVVRGLQEN